MLKTTHFLRLILISAVLSGLFACNRSANSSGGDAASTVLNPYIYAYTSGVISRAAPIRVRFAQAVIAAEQVGEEVEKGVLSFSPAIEGIGTWEDEQTVIFETAEWMKTGTEYKATLNLKKLLSEVASSESKFTFTFKTRDPFFNVDLDGLSAPNTRNLRKQELRGTLTTTDLVSKADVEQLINASQKGKALEIAWEGSDGATQYNFVVTGIERSEDASSLSINWNGSPLGIDYSEKKELEIPSLSDFKVMNAEAVQGDEQYIELSFSDPLLPEQNVNGLVTMTNYTGNFRSIIEGNKLKLYPANRVTGEHKITVNTGIRNINNFRMQRGAEWFVAFEEIKPQVRLVGKGVILPNSNGLVFPFEAIGLNAVEPGSIQDI